MLKTRAVSDLNNFKNVPLVFYFNRILNNALKKEKAVKITKATLVKYYANRLNNPSTQPQGREGGEGGLLNKVLYAEGSAPWSNPLPAFIYHFWQKRYPLQGNDMPFRYLINAASLLTVGNALSFKYEILYSGQRSASMTAAFFCWLYQPDIISHVNLTFSFTN